MKEINFKKLKVSNFLSVGNEPIEIDFSPNIHIITGVNRDKEDSKNGVGKSTLSDAIFFAIFGTTSRNIKKDSISNWYTGKGCNVFLEFEVIENTKSDIYSVTRTLEPSRVILTKNSVDISRTISKTNETITQILGTNADLFRQSIIMCINETEPFLSKTPAVKQKFVENMFKIEVFGEMVKAIRKDYNDLKRDYDYDVKRSIELDQDLAVHLAKQKEQKDNKKKRLAELEARKNSIKEEIMLLESDAKVYANVSVEKIDLIRRALVCDKRKSYDLDKEELTLLSKKITSNTLIDKLKRDIDDLEKVSSGVCIYCNQPFSESNIAEKAVKMLKLKTELEEAKENLYNISNRIYPAILKKKTEVEDRMDINEAEVRRVEKQIAKRDSLTTEINQQKSWLLTTAYDISENNNIDDFKDIIDEKNKKSEALKTTLTESEAKLKFYDACKFIISDEGVKNLTIKKMLHLLNGRLNYYLKRLDANCTCVFDEYFEESIINNKGRKCSYFNFSSGEKKRIDLAMMFTFIDIRKMQSDIHINLGMYDELLDTSIDNVGIERTLEILREKAEEQKEAVYIISHKSIAIKHATGDIIYLEKKNNITQRLPYE